MSTVTGEYQALRLERRGHVAIITLSREDKLNALNVQLAEEFHAALDEVAGLFPDVRALILTGAGRGFCSGADVGGMSQSIEKPPEGQANPLSADDPPVSITMLLAPHIRRIPQPVIAAVNGVAAGAGLSIALCCDIRVASVDARFSSIFVKRSLVPDAAASYTIAALAGTGVAAEMCLTGGVYNAQWALDHGLVNKLVPAEDLLAEAISLAEEIASNPPLAVRATKALLHSHGPDLDLVIQQEHEANAPVRGSEDQKEAVQAFLEKRQPVYKGK